MKRADWIALAERCEKAAGPDREIDAMIARWNGADIICFGGPVKMLVVDNGDGTYSSLQKYTSSLDAITALVEQELPTVSWSVRDSISGDPASALAVLWREGSPDSGGIGARSATALCSAFCRAKAEACDE